MKTREVIKCFKEKSAPIVSETSTLSTVLETMYGFKHSGTVYVVNENKELTGTISLDMLVRQILSHTFEPRIHPRRLIAAVTYEVARDIMLKNPISTTEGEDAEVVLKKMIDANVKEIAILNTEGQVIGDLTLLDLLNALPKLWKHN
ncbi:CBS domain-containing protein [Neptuniibacter sp. QD29_5]|uniref:CBS domain-containing protein n=1 Tax=unclassified Neptuniibacter TaxID=2630693 RepID=UPI0039F6BC82